MQTEITLKLSELNSDLIARIRTLLKGKEESVIRIRISEADDYLQILDRSLKDAREQKNLISFTLEELMAFEAMKEKVFMKSWQWVGDETLVKLPETVHPFVLLDHFLTEPMLLTRQADDSIHCLTNVCTHRGNLVCQNSGSAKKLQCPYHG